MPIPSFLKRSYSSLPEGIRACFNPIVESYRRFLQMYQPVFLFRGYTKAQHLPLSVVYIGTDLNHQNFWSHLIFDGDVKKTFIGHHFISIIPALLRRISPKCSLILCEENSSTGSYFNDQFFFRVPRWIGFRIDISQPMEIMVKRHHNNYKKILYKLRQHAFNYAITKSPSAFRDFYDNMYIPYVRSRFGDAGIILPYSEIYNDRIPRELIFVRKGEKVVAGVVMNYWPEKPSMGWFGVVEGRFDYVQQGALQVAYYFSIIEMQKRGYSNLNIGGSRPVINDQVTRHKIRMMAQVDYASAYDSKDNLLFIFLQDSPGLRDFLANYQIVRLVEKGKPVCTSWLQAPVGSQTEFFNAALLSQRAGFHDHDVYLFDDVEIPAQWLEKDCCRHLTIKAAHDYFPYKS